LLQRFIAYRKENLYFIQENNSNDYVVCFSEKVQTPHESRTVVVRQSVRLQKVISRTAIRPDIMITFLTEDFHKYLFDDA